jgi:hypothetical protein
MITGITFSYISEKYFKDTLYSTSIYTLNTDEYISAYTSASYMYYVLIYKTF